jgi:murein DD-endopeptidase MepM/ murein hydrolase activator NlpD
LVASSRRSQATPSPRRIASEIAERAAERFQRSTHRVRSLLSQPVLRIAANVIVALIVVSLPVVASAASRPAADTGGPLSGVIAAAASAERLPGTARAQTEARGGTITAGRNPMTIAAEGIPPVVEYTLSTNDSLSSLSNYFGISREAIAFANGISDPAKLEVGRQIAIPPLEGALYTVAAGDTVESVADRFTVDPEVIRTYNRLYFEPEHFAPGQRILVQGAALPALVYPTADAQMAEAGKLTVIARAAPAAAPAQRGGTLAWPVNGVITQYFWSGHTGVDLAAPYGAGLASSVDGVVSATGWVAVGGLRVCITSGGLEECYYHTGAVFVSPGQPVSKGQIVASIGMTGVTTGPHVHWETKINGVFQDPLGVTW